MGTAQGASATAVTTPSDRDIVVTHVVAAPRELVWTAWTGPEHVPHWMIGMDGWTMPICEVDLRPGGAYRFGWRGADGLEMEVRGVYREVAPAQRLVSTESWGSDWVMTLNTLVLTEGGAGEEDTTTITLTVGFPSREARDMALRGMTDGMGHGFRRLDEYLTCGQPREPYRSGE